jgi:hypothetical protein
MSVTDMLGKVFHPSLTYGDLGHASCGVGLVVTDAPRLDAFADRLVKVFDLVCALDHFIEDGAE